VARFLHSSSRAQDFQS